MKIKTCLIITLILYMLTYTASYSFPEGFDLGDTKEEVISKQGEPRTIMRNGRAFFYSITEKENVKYLTIGFDEQGICNTFDIRYGKLSEYEPYDIEKGRTMKEDIRSCYMEFLDLKKQLPVLTSEILTANDLKIPAGMSDAAQKEVQKLSSMDPVTCYLAASRIHNGIENGSFNNQDLDTLALYLIRSKLKCVIPDGKALYISGPGIVGGSQIVSLSDYIDGAIELILEQRPSALVDAVISPNLDAEEKADLIKVFRSNNRLNKIENIDNRVLFNSLAQMAMKDGGDSFSMALNALSCFKSSYAKIPLADHVLSTHWTKRLLACELAQKQLEGYEPADSDGKIVRAVLKKAILLNEKIKRYSEYRLHPEASECSVFIDEFIADLVSTNNEKE